MAGGIVPRPALSVVIPAFNEADRLGRSLSHVREVLAAAPGPAEVLVVVDGSTDGTAALVAAAAAEPHAVPVRLLAEPVNRGKGHCVRRGMLEARGEVRLFCDADLATPIEMAGEFVQAVGAGADVVIASRRMAGARLTRRQPWLRERLGWLFSAVVGRTLLPGITDSQCGFKAFSAAAAEAVFARQTLDEFCFDVEILAIARVLGLRVVERPVPWADGPGSRVRAVRDGAAMLRDLIRVWRHLRRGVYGACPGRREAEGTGAAVDRRGSGR
ncbi:MAG: glycosyltransferase [Vicinamibacterales bacterium]